jgi:ABC-2 type transport system ATP-binding protein
VSIEIEDLKLVLQGHMILNGIRMHMQEGEIYGLLGENGAGKSSTLAVVTGLRPATSGKVTVLGLDPIRQRTELHRAIGVLSEHGGFYGWMSAHDSLRLYAQLHECFLPELAAENLLGRVGLDPENRKPISNFSHGMKQRLGLARAILHRPKLLILDEPTNGLDPKGRKDIHDLLMDLNQRDGVGIVLCTHLLDDVERLCNRVGIIHHGETLVEYGMADLAVPRGGLEAYYLKLVGTERAS